MKTRSKIFLLSIWLGFVYIFLGLASGIWWIFTGNDFINKMIKALYIKINLLRESMACSECRFLCHDGPSYDQPHGAIWCAKKQWDGIDSFDSLHAPTHCRYFKRFPKDRHNPWKRVTTLFALVLVLTLSSCIKEEFDIDKFARELNDSTHIQQ